MRQTRAIFETPTHKAGIERRYLVTALAAKRIAKRVRTIAYSARTAATAAEASADGAVKTADEAKASANQVKLTADETAAELAGLRARTDTDAGTVTTDEENTFVDLGDPSVNLTVPASGLIEVWAQAAPGPVLFKTSPGEHTYDLRYADCGCDPADAEFVDRTLTVAPRP